MKEKLKKINWLNELYIKYKWRERKKNLGNENEEIVFYVIRRAPEEIGLFSYFMTNLGLIAYALGKGYVPVIDMENYENMFLEHSDIGKKNAWEFFFEQPCGYSIEDISRSKNVIYSQAVNLNWFQYPGIDVVRDKVIRKKWHELYKKYVVIKKEISNECEEISRKLFGNAKILGVLCRGTDYVNLKPKDHPKQPSIEMIIGKIDEMMMVRKCDKIFLATEDEEIYQALKKKFNSKLIVTDSLRLRDTGKFKISEILKEKNIDKYENGKKYLINILLLSKCQCLVAGCAGGTYGALIMTEGYEDEYVFDLGVY